MKRIVVTLAIIALAGCAVFVAGWSQLWVPAGEYAVMISKTGGVDPRVIEPARFRWQWELLIPTNASFRAFDLAPLERAVSAAGTLPSAEIYRPMLEGNPDFGWKLDYTITARVAPRSLPALVKRYAIVDRKALTALAEARLAEIGSASAEGVMAALARDADLARSVSADKAALAKLILDSANTRAAPAIELSAITVTSAKFPDFALYDMGATAYSSYQERRKAVMTEAAKGEARKAVVDYLELERFAALGEVLTEYPILIEYLAVTGSGSLEAFKAIREKR